MNPIHFRFALLALTGLSIALSLGVLGTSAHTLSVFNSQHTSNPWWLPLWAEHFDTHGTSSLLGASVTVVCLNALYVIVTMIPRLDLSNRPHMRALAAFATTLPSALVTLATVIFAHILNHRSPNIDTIQTWTCLYGERPPTADGALVPTDQSNRQFSALCTESKFALYTTLVVFLLQAAMIGLTAVTWIVDVWTAHKTKKEWKDGSSVEMNTNQATQ